MNKVKVNSGLAAIMVVGGFIAGWQTLLLVCAFLLLFAETDDKVKDVMVSMITFAIGFYLINYLIDMIFYGINNIGMTALRDLDDIVDSIIVKIDYQKVGIMTKYFISPLDKIITLVKNVINLLLDVAKFGFVVCVIANKPIKDGGIMGKVKGYVKDAVNYVNNFGKAPAAPAQAPAQPTTPSEPSAQ